ncbi:MAG TPA: hypothetical protein VM076_02770 [Gemmatimonadaceae bacterium]|nr:hypothetical protein [Gemmatimonadaceae bacterium]
MHVLVDIVAWALILAVAYIAGAGILALLGAHSLRPGDRFVLAAWGGTVMLSLALLAVSLIVPLSTTAGMVTAAVVAVTGMGLSARFGERRPRQLAEAPVPTLALAAGVATIVIGAAALASDRVTLYDSLVYHVGIMRWLHQYGAVPGVALIHNRLGHVSSWFALSAPFDAGPLAGRTANLALGIALLLVAAQGAIGAARIATRSATGADWYLALSAVSLIWPVLAYNAATPSPDVAVNVLIVVVMWAMLVIPRVGIGRQSKGRHVLGPRLVPFVLAVGAASMKLIALPAAVAAAFFYVLAPADDRGVRSSARRGVVCAITGLVLIAPLLAANAVASGCPLFPSAVACIDAPWALDGARVADYAEYIRDVARWESRRTILAATALPWVGAWVNAHPVVTALTILGVPLAFALARGPHRDGVRSALCTSVLGIAFSAWHAPAPRFLYAFVVSIPLIALAFPLAARTRRVPNVVGPGDVRRARLRAALGFLAFAFAAGGSYALASQKLNAVSAFKGGPWQVVTASSGLVLPALSEAPARLYAWRVNDIDLVTPVPRPVADTLRYRSDIDGNVGFEKCSTAPLPCTPYLPGRDVRLRSPARGTAGGFMRIRGATWSASAPQCVGEVILPADSTLNVKTSAAVATHVIAMCGGSAPPPR